MKPYGIRGVYRGMKSSGGIGAIIAELRTNTGYNRQQFIRVYGGVENNLKLRSLDRRVEFGGSTLSNEQLEYEEKFTSEVLHGFDRFVQKCATLLNCGPVSFENELSIKRVQRSCLRIFRASEHAMRDNGEKSLQISGFHRITFLGQHDHPHNIGPTENASEIFDKPIAASDNGQLADLEDHVCVAAHARLCHLKKQSQHNTKIRNYTTRQREMVSLLTLYMVLAVLEASGNRGSRSITKLHAIGTENRPTQDRILPIIQPLEETFNLHRDIEGGVAAKQRIPIHTKPSVSGPIDQLAGEGTVSSKVAVSALSENGDTWTITSKAC
ncbi:hypothetical protein C8R47DRAFT_1080236 [Mycena vitilis]|nr:hypothetical protein C8R47DRAFT_1080236 [Mycena vitilis]